MKLYLCKRPSGVWVAVNEGLATMPPFEVVDGPYDAEHARKAAVERNRRKWPPWKRHHEDSHI
jgi:hypothetical protein